MDKRFMYRSFGSAPPVNREQLHAVIMVLQLRGCLERKHARSMNTRHSTGVK